MIIIVLALSVFLFFFSACGTTRVTVRNGTESASTTISVTTNNPTSVTADPSVNLNIKNPYDSLKSN